MKKLTWLTLAVLSLNGCTGMVAEVDAGSGAGGGTANASTGGGTATNLPPLVNAGADQQLRLPMNQLTLHAVAQDAEGQAITFEWKKTAGGAATLTGADSADVQVSDLTVGTYTFEVTARDTAGASAADSVQVTVTAANLAPTVTASADMNLTLPTNTATLTATATDSDGSIASYAWSKLTGPAATLSGETTATLTLSNLVSGSYVFQILVTDNEGATGFTTVAVNVSSQANQPPTVNAGADTTITLPATASFTATATDADGSIAAWQWTKISGGPATLNGATTATLTASGLSAGTYVFQVRVTDNQGATAADQVTLTVNAANVAPAVNAGLDRTITLPTSSIMITGTATDSDGTIASVQWSKTSGPAGASLTGQTTNTVTVSNLVAGSYVFTFRATDNLGASASDTMTLTVQPAGGTGGGTAATGGGTAASGGGSAVTGGGSAVTGGGTAATGGGSAVTGGGTAATGGGTSTTTLTFTASTAYVERPWAGTEVWNAQDFADIPTAGNRAQRLDTYYRFSWTQLEGATQGSYNWSQFDAQIQQAISNHQKFSFGIMSLCNGCDPGNGGVVLGGGTAYYPSYVHSAMQAETNKDFLNNGDWIPNWNSNNYLSRWEALLNALAQHLATGTYMGVKYSDAINYVDVRGYGSWGEWHSGGIFDNMSQYPTGTRPTVATYERIIDSHITAFPDYQLVMMFAVMDANWFNNTLTPPEVTAYALNARNNRGLLGLRRDQWGVTDQYVHDYLENNNRSFGSSGPFKDIIMQRWQFAPFVGEPFGPGADLVDLLTQVNLYHACSVGNGNFDGNSTAAKDRMRTAAAAAGYSYKLTSGSITTNGTTMNIRLAWANTGLTPTYEKWDVVFTVKSSTGTVLGTFTSAFTPTLKIPGAAMNSDDTFTVSSLPTGYQVFVNVKNAYRSMPLFITAPRQTDGSYQIK